MKLTFNIDYRTRWGESVYILGNIPTLGNGNEAKAVCMTYAGGVWTLTIEINAALDALSYVYLIKNGDSVERREWGGPHWLKLDKRGCACEIHDHWQEQPMDKSYYSTMFTESVFRRNISHRQPYLRPGHLSLRIFAPSVRPNEVLAVVGATSAFGKWNVGHALRMDDSLFPEWTIDIPLGKLELPMEYKFVKINETTGNVVWEDGANRILDVTLPKDKGVSVVVAGLRFYSPGQPWKGSGTAIPVFSIRTEDDFGVGDFVSIRKLVDWLALTGQRVLQLLPINDTVMTGTWTDSYPYNANSTYALHPMYLRLEAVGRLSDDSRQKYYDDLAHELNQLAVVDYERVNTAKRRYVHELYVELADSLAKDAEFKQFKKNNIAWLKPYAAFCLLRDRFHTADFSKWKEFAVYEESAIDKLCNDNSKEIEETYFVQYHLDKQLRETREYAHSRNVVLKGDLPIGISRTSVDAWTNPRLFNLDCQAGAPPDDFSVFGQNWGFPTYNWEEMQKDGYQWWKNRMTKMSEFFDLYRIDHILGFFRIWQIPMDAVQGLLGLFNPALPYSADEMKANYDFWMDKELYSTPYIRDYFLGDFFGEYTEGVKHSYLTELGYGRYRLKDFVDTQAKIAEYFSKLEPTNKNERIRDALMGLIDEVLFIEDPKEKDKFHPRISAQYTYLYRSLTDYERWCFDRLYNDFFYHRHNDFWYGKAMQKLPALVNSTGMLVCGEDLGMIPDCVPAVMSQLQILSLEIQRMPKDPRVEFGNPAHYPYLSVCTTSTHDMGGIRQWWEENREKTQHFYNMMLGKEGTAPQYAEPWICDQIIEQHLYSPAMLTVLPWQDWMSASGTLRRNNPKEEQINVPAISRYYWRYRMHMTVEELLQQDTFNSSMKRKIADSGRL